MRRKPNREVLDALRDIVSEGRIIRVSTPDPTEQRIIQALSMLGDEFVADYRSGAMPRERALAIADQRQRDLASLGLR